MRCHVFASLLGILGTAAATPAPQASTPAPPAAAKPSTIDNKILILARDAEGASSAAAGLLAYGIPFEQVVIPQEGAALPALNTTTSAGKYSGIIVVDAVAYQVRWPIPFHCSY